MKTWIVGACIAALAASLTFTPSDADAKKRFGGGQNSGMQRDMPTRNAPDAPPAKPATPQPGAQPGAAAPAAAAGATAAAAAKKSSWLGPIAGIAAAVGLVALMSSLGLGEEFANFLMLALLGVAAVALVLWAMRRFGNKNGGRQPALATANAGAAGSSGAASANPWAAAQSPMQRETMSEPGTGASAGASSGAATSGQPFVPAWPAAGAEPSAALAGGQPISYERGNVPADFDTAGFERVASMIFIRMQAAYDAADLNDLRTFTTPEMFASVKMDLQDRSASASSQHTEVERVEADVLDVATEDARQIVSVRFHGQIREDGSSMSEAFDEVWHLVKPTDNSRSWAIAGIQQQPVAVGATH